ncbi:hypothetical protein V6N12_051909 [Hibiscus sabdariffa]|uniref:Uncharacterized protein n=1 Tax=Hibiscus sabdariffa TaxID=183260 RepID=A0ABR2GGQ3_9ROSI
MSNCSTKGLLKQLPNLLYYQYDLRYLNLSYNNFDGQNPSWLLENNTRLQQFFIADNSFKGPLQLPKLVNVDMYEVDMSGNKMQGQIPVNICLTFPQLQAFSLSRNAFEAKRNSLRTLRLSNNKLSGKIPPTIFSSTTLEKLYLDGNNFDGEMPNIDISAVNYPLLRDIDLSNNYLSGRLP